MKNIELAIQKEQEYINDVINMEPNNVRPELLDYISIAGYDNIEDFHNDKNIKHLENIKFISRELTSEETIQRFSKVCEEIALSNENTIFYNTDLEHLCVCVPANFKKQKEIEELDLYPIYAEYYSDEGGGIIISGDQDLRFGMCIDIKDHYKMYEKIKNKLIDYLNMYYNDVVYTGNDILINGYKVIGFAVREIGDKVLSMFNVNFHNYMKYIDALCTYSPDKIPGYIDNDNITAHTVLNEIKSILNFK